MRPFRSLLFSVALLSTLLIPATGVAAAWTNAWCAPGAALSGTAPAGTDANLVKIVNHVCVRFTGCCQTGGRWTLACVQEAANYARQNNLSVSNNSDYCGRYAWAAQSIGRTKQYYPRDFSLFAFGDVSGFEHVAGPVAAQGNVSTGSFSLNWGQSEGIALVATGNITLTSGTIVGYAYYGGWKSLTNVTFLPPPSLPFAPVPSALKDSSVIDFASASRALTNMSTQVSLYAAIRTSKPKGSNTISFAAPTGTILDPQLNVFSLDSSDLTNTFSFVFDVPKGSAVIINVNVTNNTQPAFMSAGFSGPNGAALPTSPSKILWNFPGATQLTLQSLSFPGSILAPKAAATLRNGNLSGTVVVKSALAGMELYLARYQVSGVGGCLNLDPTWSCSNDTVLDYATSTISPSVLPATAPVIAAEAGFLQIDGGSYTAENKPPRASPTHRIWYSFQPADATPKNKPLAVFFNGGPGAATSAILFSFNTATWTLDPDVAGTGKVASNPSSWTKFANLLYIDAPGTGFSYPLPWVGVQEDTGIDMDRDAGIFLRFITRFILRHPALQDNRVIVVGESYGGVRATRMLYYLYNYQTLGTGAYRDAQLASDLENYFKAVFPLYSPVGVGAIATRFGHQVLISPNVAGWDQQQYIEDWHPPTGYCFQDQNNIFPTYTVPCYRAGYAPNGTYIGPNCDTLNCDKQLSASDLIDHTDWGWDQTKSAVTTLTDKVATLSQVLGVDSTTIAWMYAINRTPGGYARGSTTPGRSCGSYRVDCYSSQEMTDTFGTLDPDDSYFVALSPSASKGYGDGTLAAYKLRAGQWNDHPGQDPPPHDPNGTPYEIVDTGITTGLDFVSNLLYGVDTFITVTKYDTVIWSPSIQMGLNDGNFGPLVSSVFYDPNGVHSGNDTPPRARPGMMFVYTSLGAPWVTMAGSYESGHSVSMRAAAAADLLADVMQWYAASPN